MEITNDNNFVPQGWQCPICKRVYSPTTPMCMYCGREQNTTITANGIIHTYCEQEVESEGKE